MSLVTRLSCNNSSLQILHRSDTNMVMCTRWSMLCDDCQDAVVYGLSDESSWLPLTVAVTFATMIHMDELKAMAEVAEALDRLGGDTGALQRVLVWTVARYGSCSPAPAALASAPLGLAPPATTPSIGAQPSEPDPVNDTELGFSLGRRAKRWLADSQVKPAELEMVFYPGEDELEFLGTTIPGSSKSERTRNAYLLSGVMGFLRNDSPEFEDTGARSICVDFGCYDQNNHSGYLKGLRGQMVGSKSDGYRLTKPGEQSAGALLQQLVESCRVA